MKRAVSMFIDNLVPKNETIVIALSGGVDSMALFHCLQSLGYSIVVCHVNHGVRNESETEYAYIEDMCKKLNIPFYGMKLKHIESNFQEEARKLRYEFFKDVASKCNTKYIASAHHLDDLIETSLMKIVRGSNMLGYSGIKADTIIDGFHIIRPLLCVSKNDIYQYANNNSIVYFEDSSNETDHYTRNRYRHHIIPLLKEENPNLYSEWKSFSNQLSDAFNFIRKTSLTYLAKWDNIININEYKALDSALQYDIIQYMLEQEKIVQIACKTEAIKCMIINNKANMSFDLGINKQFIISYNEGFIMNAKNDLPYKIEISEYGEYKLPNNDLIIFTKNKLDDEFIYQNYVNICYNNTVRLPLIVRNRIEGDIIHFPYGDKKLMRHLIDKKIPLHLRDIIPIVTDQDNNILGVIGIGPKEGNGEDYLYWVRRTTNDK